MNTQIKESQLSRSFCSDATQSVKKLIDSSISFSVVGMPAMGISIFLRYLITYDFAYFIHVDIYELQKYTKKDLYRLLLNQLSGVSHNGDEQEVLQECKKQLENLVLKYKRVVIVFNRFDQLQKEFDQNFFNNLRSLRDVDKEKIVMIFAVNKPLSDIAPKALIGGNLNMFSKSFYLKPYSQEDLILLITLNGPKDIKDNKLIKQALELSGGHYQLLQLLLKSERSENFILDSFIREQMKQIYESLNHSQRIQVQRIALGKKVNSIDGFLQQIGLVKENNRDYSLFTPLFNDFVKSNLPFKLPVKEEELFHLLIKRKGNLVTKEEIFETLWPEGEEPSDWALNALIYRLRKNPSFILSGYTIESQKKLGYILYNV